MAKSDVLIIDLVKEEYARIFDKLVDLDEPMAWVAFYTSLFELHNQLENTIQHYAARRNQERGFNN